MVQSVKHFRVNSKYLSYSIMNYKGLHVDEVFKEMRNVMDDFMVQENR